MQEVLGYKKRIHLISNVISNNIATAF